MNNKIFACLLILSCTNLSAAEDAKIEFSGVGQLKAKPDYVSLEFSVRSECYATPIEAQEATDKIVEKIDRYLQTLKPGEDKHFKILINGGFTSAFSKWHENKEICRNTFQKDTQISLNMSLGENFSSRFAQIQSHVLNYFENPADNINYYARPQTFVTLGTPEPKITREHRTKLERQARNLALQDAIANFKETIKTCAKQPYKISSIRETQTSYFQPRPQFFQAQTRASDGQKQSAAPVRFDDLRITKELAISFQVDGPLCFESGS